MSNLTFNKRRLQEVRDQINAIPEGQFDMGSWLTTTDIKNQGGDASTRKMKDLAKGPECGTVGCIAGWVVTLYPDETVSDLRLGNLSSDMPRIAGKALGMSPDDARSLFLGETIVGGQHSFSRIGKRHAVRHLDNILNGRTKTTKWPSLSELA